MESSSTGWTPPTTVIQGTLQAPIENTSLSRGIPPPPPEKSLNIPEGYLQEPAPVMRREHWGAKMPKWTEKLVTPVKKVVLTWTETDPCYNHEDCKNIVRNIQEAHLAEPDVPDIKHHFLLGKDGAMYEGRGFMTLGPKYPEATAKGHVIEGESLQIAFIEKCANKPSDVLLKVLSECLLYALSGKFVEKTFEMYWMSENEVLSIQPTTIEEPRVNKEDKDPAGKYVKSYVPS